MVICFKCFLGNENQRQENCVMVKGFLLIQHTEGTGKSEAVGVNANGDKRMSYTPHATC